MKGAIMSFDTLWLMDLKLPVTNPKPSELHARQLRFKNKKKREIHWFNGDGVAIQFLLNTLSGIFFDKGNHSDVFRKFLQIVWYFSFINCLSSDMNICNFKRFKYKIENKITYRMLTPDIPTSFYTDIPLMVIVQIETV